MSDEKKSTYTGYTEARKKANEKYLKESVEDIRIRVPKGQKEVVKSHSDKMGESMNAFAIRAITKAISDDFKIVSFQEGKYIANKDKLFDAYHCVAPQSEQHDIISDIAASNLNCFLLNAKEAFNSNLPFKIGDKLIENPKELLEWFSEFGSDSFKEEMTSRFKTVFPDSER